MSVPDDFAQRQLRRVLCLRNFPDTKDGVQELFKAFSIAPSEDALTTFVSQWLRQNVFAPQPADVYEAFPPRTEYWQRPPGTQCPLCGDTGWKLIERGGYTAATACECKKLRLVPKKNGS